MRVRPESVAFTILVGALAALPPLSVDIGLPAFPALERGLDATAAGAGLTLSLFLAGFATAQLILGPLSDRIGRRPVLLAGLAVYTLAGALCAAAPSIGALLGFRLLQGAAAAAGPVMALAIVRDLFDGAAARTRLSYVAMVLSVAPILAPTLGGGVVTLAGWRGVYAFLALAGAVLLPAATLGMIETRRRPSAHPRLLHGFARVLGHRRAVLSALANALSFGAVFAYVSGSPLLLMGTLGLPAPLFAASFALTTTGILAGSWLNGRLAARGVAPALPMWLSLLLSLIACAALLLLLAAGGRTLVPLLLLLTGFCFARGIIGPTATHGAMEPMAQIAGAASALIGFMQMSTGALSSAVVAALFPRLGPYAMPLVMTLFAAGSLLAWRGSELAAAAPSVRQA